MEQKVRLLTTGEVAKVLDVSRHAVLRWIKQGKLKAIELPSGRYKIPENEVEKIWKQLRVTESR